MRQKLSFVVLVGLILSGCSLISRPASAPTPTVSVAPSEVTLESPESFAVIESPVEIKGSAPGTWFFEAQMSAKLVIQGNVIAEVPLTAEGEWMTEEMVPFSGQLSFNKPDTVAQATLIIENANPSGLPENAKSYSVPVQVNGQ